MSFRHGQNGAQPKPVEKTWRLYGAKMPKNRQKKMKTDVHKRELKVELKHWNH